MIKCVLDDKHNAVDSIPVWTDGGRTKLEAPLCRLHIDESDAMGMDFDIKYASKFKKMAVKP